MSSFANLPEIVPQGIWDGIVVRAVHGERITLGIVELAPGSLVPEHSHDNEQLGMVLSGSLTFRIGDETRELGPGGTWRIASDAPHEVTAGPSGAVVIDVFAPPRNDWEAVEQQPARAPLWPESR